MSTLTQSAKMAGLGTPLSPRPGATPTYPPRLPHPYWGASKQFSRQLLAPFPLESKRKNESELSGDLNVLHGELPSCCLPLHHLRYGQLTTWTRREIMTTAAELGIDLESLGPIPEKIVTVTIEGILTADDLVALVKPDATPAEGQAQPEPQVPQEAEDPTDLKRVKERHHAVARLLAKGMSNRIVATLTNYTESHISVLAQAPAMQELIAFYRSGVAAEHELVSERLKSGALKAWERLCEQVERGEADPNVLLGMAKLGLDRAGHGPTSSVNVKSQVLIADAAELRKLELDARKGSTQYLLPPPDRSAQAEDELNG